MLKKSLLPAVMMSVLVVLASPAAYAQGTPDGVTPANEGVCDGLIAGTPGLYGLCVGFCEAQDCEATFDSTTGNVTFDPSCKPSSNKLLENYNKRALPGDPPMPCITVVSGDCPCWTQSELAQIGDGVTTTCDASGAVFDATIVGTDGTTGEVEAVVADADAFDGPGCFYQEETPSLITRMFSLGLDELLTCITSIEDECVARGF